MPKPSSPYEKYKAFDLGTSWIDVAEIPGSVSGWHIEDFLSCATAIKVPISQKEFFLLTNHQKLDLWPGQPSVSIENCYRGTGLAIWHIKEQEGISYDFMWYGGSGCGPIEFPGSLSEKRKVEDFESAIGLWGKDGLGTTPDPVFGWDNLDFWTHYGGEFIGYWPNMFYHDVLKSYVETHIANYLDLDTLGYCSKYDFFSEATKTEFTHLTNPSSDGYNFYEGVQQIIYEPGSYYGEYNQADYDENLGDVLCLRNGYLGNGIYGETGFWSERVEYGFPQNIATHIAIKNIHREGTDMVCDILLD